MLNSAADIFGWDNSKKADEARRAITDCTFGPLNFPSQLFLVIELGIASDGSGRNTLVQASIDTLAEEVFLKLTGAIQDQYPTRVLAVLFKNPSMSKHVFDIAST